MECYSCREINPDNAVQCKCGEYLYRLALWCPTCVHYEHNSGNGICRAHNRIIDKQERENPCKGVEYEFDPNKIEKFYNIKKYKYKDMIQEKFYPNIQKAIWLLGLYIVWLFVLFNIFDIIGSIFNVLPFFEHYMTRTVISLIITGLVLKAGFQRTDAHSFKEVFPLKSIKLSLFLPIFLTVVGILIVSSEISNLIRTIFPMPPKLDVRFMNISVGKSFWGLFFVVSLVGPLAEEFLFRGLLLYGFLKCYSIKKAITASAIFFALFHLNPFQFFPTFILGIVLAWWFVKTGSLIPCLFGHALYNTIPLILLGIFYSELSGLKRDPTKIVFHPFWLAAGLAIVLFGIWLFIRMSENKTSTPDPSNGDKILQDGTDIERGESNGT